MTTEKQRQANQQNAQLSTGPRSDAGRARSRANALKWGITAKQMVIRGETAEEFEQLREAIFDHFQPVGLLEELLTGQVAEQFWRCQRIRRAEAEVLNAAIHDETFGIAHKEVATRWKDIEFDPDVVIARRLDSILSSVDKQQIKLALDDKLREEVKNKTAKMMAELSQQQAGITTQGQNLGRVFLRLAGGQDFLARFQKYEMANENALYRALHELERLQTARRGANVAAPHVLEVGVHTTKPDDGPPTGIQG
jgi:hypothetical protein